MARPAIFRGHFILLVFVIIAVICLNADAKLKGKHAKSKR